MENKMPQIKLSEFLTDTFKHRLQQNERRRALNGVVNNVIRPSNQVLAEVISPEFVDKYFSQHHSQSLLGDCGPIVIFNDDVCFVSDTWIYTATLSSKTLLGSKGFDTLNISPSVIVEKERLRNYIQDELPKRLVLNTFSELRTYLETVCDFEFIGDDDVLHAA
jgi:hypothetical protein